MGHSERAGGKRGVWEECSQRQGCSECDWEARRGRGALGEGGRFLPYWFRDPEDNDLLRLTPLVDMETSLYYQGCKDLFLESGLPQPMVTEPDVYEGKMIVEQTFPILIDGRFSGVAGVDRALSDIVSFLLDIGRRDDVDVFLISRAGRFGSRGVRLRPDLRAWVEARSEHTGEDPTDIVVWW